MKKKDKKMISFLLAVVLLVQLIGTVFVETASVKASQIHAPNIQVDAEEVSRLSLFYVRVSQEEFSTAPYIYITQGNKELSGTWPGTKMESEGKYWIYRSSDFSSASVMLSIGDGWNSSTGNITGSAEYCKSTGRWSGINDATQTSTPTDRSFYIRVEQSEVSAAPYIYAYSDPSGSIEYTGSWPGMQMWKEGEYYVYYTDMFSGAYVNLSDGHGGWQSRDDREPAFYASGWMEYSRANDSWSTWVETRTSTPSVKPTVTPTVKPTPTPTVKPTASPTVKPTATPTPKPTPKPTATPKSTVPPTVKPTEKPKIKKFYVRVKKSEFSSAP